MEILKSIDDVKKYLGDINGKTIGFVPTMGYLHDGHLSLIKRAKSENDICITSIFVNPIQFGPNEDFESYPRDIEKDTQNAANAGCDAIFYPTNEIMYPEGFATLVRVNGLTENLCGLTRPTHFEGVTTVVTKLFNIITPTKAYFGQKDAQQLLIIKKMVKDLNMNPEIIGCPIVREADGLAMSSRNVYLSKEEREQAVILSKSLKKAANLLKSGEKNAKIIIDTITEEIQKMPLARIDYVKAVDQNTVKDVELIEGDVLIALAVYFGSTRLIDNIMINI